MRILLVTENRGASRHYAMLQAAGHNITIFSPSSARGEGLPALRRKLASDFGRLWSDTLLKTAPEVVVFSETGIALTALMARDARRAGAPTLWLLNDYRLLCPATSCRTRAGNNCEECVRNLTLGLRRGCVDGPMSERIRTFAESMYWNRRRLEESVDSIVVPSDFMRAKLLEAGYSSKKVDVLVPHCVVSDNHLPSTGQKPYFFYSGPLMEHEGVETLAKAAALANVNILMDGDGPMARRIADRYGDNVTLLPHGDDHEALLAAAVACVAPAEWYVTVPSSLIRALCLGVPVVASAIGAHPALVNSSNGILFEPGNAEELAKIMRSFDRRHAFDRNLIARDALKRFSLDACLNSLNDTLLKCRQRFENSVRPQLISRL